jgi:surface antigen
MKKSLVSLLILALVAGSSSGAMADPWWGPHHEPRGPGFSRPDPFFTGPVDRWHDGRWHYGLHEGYTGWWWIVGDMWYLYNIKTESYPDLYTQPVVVIQQGQAPVVYETTTTAPTTTTTVTTTSPARTSVTTSSTAPSNGTIVNFKDSAPAQIDATQASSTFVDKQGRTCREYQTSIVVGGVTKPAHGTACLEADGSWRVVK